MAAPRVAGSDRAAAAAVVAAASLAVALVWALPVLQRPVEMLEDAPGHLAAAQALRDRLLPWPTGWDRGAFLGWPQDVAYPPLAHLAVALLGLALPIELALRVVLAAALLAVPWAAARLGRSRGLSPGRAALYAVATTGLLCLAPAGNGMGLSGSFASSVNVGLLANAVGLPLALLAAASLPRALATRRGLPAAAAACSLALLAHLVCGLALALLAACEVATLLLRAPRRRARTLRRAGALLALVTLLTAAWSWPFVAALGYGQVSHVPSGFPPGLVLALVAGGAAGALARRGTRRRLAGTLAYLGALAALLAAGDLGQVPLHLYRFHLFVVLAALLPLAALPRGRRALQVAGAATGALALACVLHGARPVRPAPAALALPADLPPGRVLVVAAPGHQPSGHWLEFEFPRRAGMDAALGLFVESSPLARWVGNTLHMVDPAAPMWGTPLDDAATRAVAHALEPGAPRGPQAASDALAVLRRALRELGVGAVLTETRLPEALADNAGPLVWAHPAQGAADGRHEVRDDAFAFRLRRLREPPEPAAVLHEPLVAVPWQGAAAWHAAVAPWFFAPQDGAPRPVVARAGLDLSPAPADARVIACEISADGREVLLRVEAERDVPVVVRQAWHPGWRARAGERELAVDRVAPGLCLLRGRGEIRLWMPRGGLAVAGAAASTAAWAVLLALGLKRGRRPGRKASPTRPVPRPSWTFVHPRRESP